MGIISKSAVRKFLARPRQDFRNYKTLSNAELDAMEDRLPYASPHYRRLKKHNRACFVIGARYPFFAFFNDTGTGKTYLAAALADYHAEVNEVGQVLVLVPNRINKAEWRRTVDKHAPNLSVLVLEGSSENKWRQLDENTHALLVVETYGGLTRMVSEVGIPKRSRKKKRRLLLEPKLLAALQDRFGGLITDEGTGAGAGLGSHDSLAFRICRALTKTCRMYFNLTGTPHGRDPQAVWPQMKLIDEGYSLGDTLGLFRAAFCREELTGWSTKYVFRKRLKMQLHRFLAHRSIAFEADQADLPRINSIMREVSLPEDAQSYYERARDRLIAARGNYQEQKNAFLRMRQISSGFVGYFDDEAGEKAKLIFPEQPKLEALLSDVESLRPEQKAIIYYEFTFSGLRIARALKELKLPFLHIYGATRDPERALLEFDEPNCQFLILQNRFGQGPNLQAAQYALYYETPVSAIMRKQTRRRVERQYSKHKTVFLIDYIVQGTVDLQILEHLREGQNLFEAIIQGKAKPR